MVTCVVSSCKNTSKKISKNKDGITFHRFPRDCERRKKWEIAVNRENNWEATSSSVVCSKHFSTCDFYVTESGLRRLSGEAVPSGHICPFEDQEPIFPKNPEDIKPTDSKEVIELKNKVRRLEHLAYSRKKQLNLMWQSKKRLQKKVDKLKNMIKHLVHSKDGNWLGAS